MCLNTLTKRTNRKHNIGYKFFSVNEQLKYSSQFRRSFDSNNEQIFEIGKWYKDPSEDLIYENNLKYKTGYHYLRLLPPGTPDDLNKYCFKKDLVLAVIQIKDITATGTDNTLVDFHTLKAGACRRFKIKKILYGGVDNIIPLLPIKTLPNEFIEMLNLYLNKGTYKKPDYQMFKHIVLKNPETFVKCIGFIDAFIRNYVVFKFFTGQHFYLLKNDKDYQTQFEYFTRSMRTSRFLFREVFNYNTDPEFNNDLYKKYQMAMKKECMNHFSLTPTSDFWESSITTKKMHCFLAKTYLYSR